MNTTRRFPRTTAEAFGGCEYACPLERPARTPYPRILWIAMVLGIVVALIAARAT